jgi:hypothetical protein
MSHTDDQGGYWDKLIGQARVSVVGASDDELRVQLFDVLAEFFDTSSCWSELITFMVIPQTLDYPLTPLTGRIIRLSGVLDQNLVVQPAIMPEIGTVHFQYPYQQTQPMTAIVIKNVTDPFACYPPYIPDWVLPLHGLKLLDGIIGRMMLQAGFSYSNPQLARFHLQRFYDGIAAAYVAAGRANTVGAQRWMFPQAYRVFGQKGGVSTYNVHPSPMSPR